MVDEKDADALTTGGSSDYAKGQHVTTLKDYKNVSCSI